MKCSEAVLKRVRDYAINEPSFTPSFAAWDLSRTGAPITSTPVRWATEELARLGIVELVEDGGRAGKVYAYVPPPSNGHRRLELPELEEHRIAADLAPRRGVIVPHTRIEGTSDSPGRDRRRQAAGVRLARRKGR